MDAVLGRINSLSDRNFVSYEEPINTKTSTTIEYEVHMSRDVNDSYDFKKLDEFIKKRCQLHGGKHELRIKVTGIGF